MNPRTTWLATLLVASCTIGQSATAVGPEVAAAVRHERGGDLDRIDWIRPFAKARELARAQNRVLLVKPILGGSNRPDPAGVPCGGENDCEGSW